MRKALLGAPYRGPQQEVGEKFGLACTSQFLLRRPIRRTLPCFSTMLLAMARPMPLPASQIPDLLNKQDWVKSIEKQVSGK